MGGIDPAAKAKSSGFEQVNSAEYPEFIARFYDLIYHQMRDGVDNQFYLDRIKETRGKILEAGVGTGRLFTEALKSSADIYGIDLSPSMLKVLKSKLNVEQQKRVSQQNIVDFKSNNRFDLVIAPFRVFMHLTTKEEQSEALNNVYAHLNHGGKFIFDAFVPDLKMLINGLDNVSDFEGEFEPGNRVKRFFSTKPDLISQLINVTFRIDWNEGNSYYSREWKSSMRFFFRYELEHLIERSQFSHYKILGDFMGNELNPESKEFIIFCQK
ncbi:MAG: class I SAM-dependent methyltransferase [Bacteroidales bacterium]